MMFRSVHLPKGKALGSFIFPSYALHASHLLLRCYLKLLIVMFAVFISIDFLFQNQGAVTRFAACVFMSTVALCNCQGIK